MIKDLPEKLSKWTLLLIAFVSGFCIVGIEITASRLLAPFFGTSIIIWSSIIGVVLIALACGYFLGGSLAERKPKIDILLNLILAAGIFFLFVPFITRPLILLLSNNVLTADISNLVFFIISFSVASVLFGLPLILLGMISPVLVKIYSLINNKPGESAGLIFTVSTIGSVAGTFVPALWLIPTFGTKTSIIIFAVILILFGCFRFGLKKIIIAVLALLLALILYKGYATKQSEDVLYEGESVYQHLKVVEDSQGNKFMLSNQGIGIESVYNKNKILTKTIYDYFNLLPFLISSEKPKRVLIIGLAGGTVPRQMNYFFKDKLVIDGVEIDKKIIDVAAQYFDLGKLSLNVINQDGRVFLDQTKNRYDLIIVDAFQNELYIPWTLTTYEFWETAKLKLNDGGMVAINLNSPTDNSELFLSITNTQAKVFKNVFSIKIPGSGNHMTIASETDLDFSRLKNIQDPDLKSLVQIFSELTRISFNPQLSVLTDDKAPIELMTDKALSKFLKNSLDNYSF